MKGKIMNKQNGITLIALVITIIVLLILAGVAISMLSGKNGILNRTTEAGEESEKSSINDQVKLAAMAALTAGNGKIEGEKAYKELNDGLIEAGYEGEEITSLPKTITINGTEYVIQKDGAVRETSDVEKKVGEEVKGTKAVLLDANYEQIVVPVGFKIQEGSPTEVKKGIVVEAKDGSEFVWVPVTEVTKMAKEINGKDGKGKQMYEGILYDFKSEDGKYSATPMLSYGQGTDSNREPSLVTDSFEDTKAILDNIDGVEYDAKKGNLDRLGISDAKKFGEVMQEDYDEMIESVAKNKGFYVGRYKTSLDATGYAQSIPGGTITKASTKETKYWYGLYKVQKEYSEKHFITDSVGSSMIWGSQYDQMLIWMQENNIDVKQSTPKDSEGNSTVRNETNIAGEEKSDKLNNIYDLCGINTEITLEADSVDSRISRGSGVNPEKWGIEKRTDTSPDSSSSCSSRLSLYVK